MKELPKKSFLEGFYIWFDKDCKEEYYGTPLYRYCVDWKKNVSNGRLTIKLEKDIRKVLPSRKKVIDKYPGSLKCYYVEKFGMMLMRFLNADFSTFEKAYNTFFYAYGFELLKEYIPYQEMTGQYNSEKELLEVMKRIYEDSLGELYELQSSFRNCVNDIFNLNGQEDLKNLKANSKFTAYIIKHKGNIYRYSNDIEVFLDNHSQKDSLYSDETYENLAKKIEKRKLAIKKRNIYTSEKLSNILFLILEEVTQTENLPIKTCQNCGKYFIPTSRQDEVYCEFPDENGKTCKEKGASLTYKKNLESSPALLEYRRMYQKKFMNVVRNKDNKKLKEEFDVWKMLAKIKVKEFKDGKITEDELMEWLRDIL